MKTEKGKELRKRSKAMYEHNKKYINILPNIFPKEIPVDYHHADGKWFVVPLPKSIHQKSGIKTDNHLSENMKWIKFYYGLNLEDFLWDGLPEMQQ
jgi:hypothetical protein